MKKNKMDETCIWSTNESGTGKESSWKLVFDDEITHIISYVGVNPKP